jgi:hypothetical protein
MEEDDISLLPVLPRPFEEPLLRRLEAEPPLLATLVRVDLLAEARPLAELLFLAAEFLTEDLDAVDFFAADLPDDPPEREAELPPLDDEEVLLVPRAELPLEDADDLPAVRDVALLEDFAALREEPLLDDFAADFLAPRAAVLREVDFLAALPFLATRLRVVLLADANPLFAEVFLAAVLEEDFLAAVFFTGDFLAVDFLAADFLAAPLDVVLEAALLEPLLDDFVAVLEPPRPEERPLEAARPRPEDLDAALDEDLPPALRVEVFLEAAFLVDFAIVNGF